MALIACAGAACTSARPQAPLDSPDERRAPPPPAAAADVTVEPTALIEEELAAEVPARPQTAAAAPAVGPPAVLDTITPATPPHVAAATRLAENGRARMAEGDYGAALEQLERAIAVDPANAYAYYFLAALHLHHGTYDQAITFADRAAALSIDVAPDWASRAYSLQGNAFEAAGRFDDARRAYGRALAAAPHNLAAQVGLVRLGGDGTAPP